jgi:uncharacterized protein (TIGR03083 family)
VADRTFTRDEAVSAYDVAGRWFLSTLRSVEDDQWDLPGLGEWTVRELVAHTVRAFRTVDQYLDGTVRDPTPLPSAAAYFRTVLAEIDPHPQIAIRARREVPELGDDPVAVAEGLADMVGRLAERAPAATPVHTFVGVIALPDYLATRVVELVVHTLDLAAAIGLDLPVPPLPGRIAIQVLADLVDDDFLADLLLALTGRAGLVVGLNALA